MSNCYAHSDQLAAAEAIAGEEGEVRQLAQAGGRGGGRDACIGHCVVERAEDVTRGIRLSQNSGVGRR